MPSWSQLRRYLTKSRKKSPSSLGGGSSHKHAKFLNHASKHDIYLLHGQGIICSRGSGEIRKNKWQEILKHQLKITQEEFNNSL